MTPPTSSHPLMFAPATQTTETRPPMEIEQGNFAAAIASEIQSPATPKIPDSDALSKAPDIETSTLLGLTVSDLDAEVHREKTDEVEVLSLLPNLSAPQIDEEGLTQLSLEKSPLSVAVIPNSIETEISPPLGVARPLLSDTNTAISAQAISHHRSPSSFSFPLSTSLVTPSQPDLQPLASEARTTLTHAAHLESGFSVQASKVADVLAIPGEAAKTPVIQQALPVLPVSGRSNEALNKGGAILEIADALPSIEAESAERLPSTGRLVAEALQAPAPAANATKLAMNMNMRFGETGWPEALAERSAQMVSQSIKFAEIQLDPAELGPLQIRVSVQQDQAMVSFTAQHAGVREALDQTLTRLRELLAEQGIDLADVDISDQSSEGERGETAEGSDGHEASSEMPAESASTTESVTRVNVRQGIDHYV